MFFCHSGHRLAACKAVPVDELGQESLALLSGRYRTRAAVDTYLEAAGVKPKRIIAFNTFSAILQAVALGGLSTIMPADVSRGTGVRDVCFIALDPPPPERVVCLLSPPVVRHTLASLEMAERIKSAFR